MKNFLLTSLSLLLLGCPTPPDPTSNNQAQNQNNPKAQGQNQNNQPAAGNQGNAPQGPKGPQGPGNPQTPTQNTLLPPENDEELADGAIIGLFNETGGMEPPPRYSQEAIKEQEHITISGSIECKGDDCDKPMLIRITPFTAPDMENGKPKDPEYQGEQALSDEPGEKLPEDEEAIQGIQDGVITQAKITDAKSFSVLTLQSDNPVVLELIIDANDDNSPSPGEKFVIYEGGGGLMPNKDISDIEFKFSSDAVKAPLGGTRSPENPNQ